MVLLGTTQVLTRSCKLFGRQISQGVGKMKLLNLRIVVVSLALSFAVTAQTTKQTKPKSELCTPESAMQMINQQLVAAKTLNNQVQRIAVTIRGADLLWAYQREKSRAAFTEALDLAKQNFQAQGDAPIRAGKGLMVENPDQRFVVIRAIAKRDPAWARKLTDEILSDETGANKDTPFKDEPANVRTSEKLLQTASLLIPQDVTAAMNFAHASLKYPASYSLTAFLYKLSETSQSLADDFYRRAFLMYREKQLREFLYLASYPFGADSTGGLPVTGNYRVPGTFRRDPALQSMFAQALLVRARRAMEKGVDPEDNYLALSGLGHIAEAISLIEPELRKQFPDLATQLTQVRSELLTTLSPEIQQNFASNEKRNDHSNPGTFEERVETIEKTPDVDRRDQQLAMLLLNSGANESLDLVLRTTEKITDSQVRSQLLDWLYFNRAKRALTEKTLAEAAKLAANIQELDQRAYLYSEIAKGYAAKPDSQNAARDLLEQIVSTAEKAPNTIVTARAFLAAASLYLRFDADRAVAVLAQAIKIINQLENADFSQELFFRRIEGKDFGTYGAYRMPGANPESAFRDMAKIDFDSAIVQSTQITDKALRAQVALTLADFCLTQR